MAILRLRLRGKLLIGFPDSEDHRFFFFLRNAGLYHFWVEDIPHVLISLALLNSADDEGFQVGTALHDLLSFLWGTGWFAAVSPWHCITLVSVGPHGCFACAAQACFENGHSKVLTIADRQLHFPVVPSPSTAGIFAYIK